jgi:hypothetical protein
MNIAVSTSKYINGFGNKILEHALPRGQFNPKKSEFYLNTE